jgi:hypothetical protein
VTVTLRNTAVASLGTSWLPVTWTGTLCQGRTAVGQLRVSSKRAGVTGFTAPASLTVPPAMYDWTSTTSWAEVAARLRAIAPSLPTGTRARLADVLPVTKFAFEVGGMAPPEAYAVTKPADVASVTVMLTRTADTELIMSATPAIGSLTTWPFLTGPVAPRPVRVSIRRTGDIVTTVPGRGAAAGTTAWLVPVTSARRVRLPVAETVMDWPTSEVVGTYEALVAFGMGVPLRSHW